MGKSEVPKHKAKRKPRKGAKSPKRGLLFYILAGATLVGGFSAAITFLPRVSVTASEPVDVKNPFSVLFTITNNNFIPLTDVNISLGIGQMTTAPAEPNPNFLPYFTSRFVRPEWENHTLAMDEQFTITINDIFTSTSDSLQVTGADLAIVVDYKPWFIQLTEKKYFALKESR